MQIKKELQSNEHSLSDNKDTSKQWFLYCHKQYPLFS